MKKIIIALITLMLLVGCSEDDVAANTTAENSITTDTTVIMTSGTEAETTESSVTTEVSVSIDKIIDGLTIHSLASSELEDFRYSFAEDMALGVFVVEVTDRPGMYLIIEDAGVSDNGESYNRASVKRVICDGVVQDCDLPFVFGPSGFSLFFTDEYTVVGRRWHESYYYIFCEGEWLYVPSGSGKEGSSPQLYIKDGSIKYIASNPKYTMAQTFYDILSVVDNLNDWDEELGSVFVRDGKVYFEAEEERPLNILYPVSEIIEDFEKLKGNVIEHDGDIYDFSRFKTIEELLEYNYFKAHPDEFLKTMPVYEISYEKNCSIDAFDRYGAEEYSKFERGDDFNEFFALRFREYPDIYLIVEVVQKNGIESVYHQRYLHGVIRNGKTLIVSGDFYGPAIFVDITEDFVCVSGRASGIGEMIYFHNGGVESFLSSDIGDWGHIVQLHESNNNVQYVFFSYQYPRQSAGLHFSYTSPDDRFYDTGTVQLVNGRIQYITEISYTIGTWYDTQTELKERSGCSNVDEFMKWYKEKFEVGDFESISISLP